jgi:hypothetical protein
MDYSLITFLIILAAATLVTCGFVVNRFFGPTEGNRMRDPSNEQLEYMRSVRMRNNDALEGTAR